MKKALAEVLRALFGLALMYLIVTGIWWAVSSLAYKLVWDSTPAPWENVHAFFYPNANDLTNDVRKLNIGSLEACRTWAQDLQSVSPMRGDYECGVGCKSWEGTDMFVCRLTIR